MTHIFRVLRRFGGIAVCALLLTGLSFASGWSGAAAQLAGNIADISGPGTAHLSYRNASSLAPAEFQEFTRELENALRAKGLRLVTAGAAADVTITASENVRGYVFVAEVQQGRDVRTAVVLAPKTAATAVQGGGAAVTLRKALLIELDEPVLDTLQLDANQLVVLTPSRAALYKRNNDLWQLQAAFEMQAGRPMPMDVRGRLLPASGHSFDAYLPGMACASVTVSPMVLACRSTDDPWPIGEKQSAFFNAARNFFNGVISPGIGSQTNVEPFYSAIALPRPGYTLWMFTGVDGRVRLADGKDVTIVRPTSAVREWGSDIAALNGCGRGPLIIATGGGDATVVDTLRAYEMPDREPMAVSTTIDLPGPVTALWPQSDQRSAVAVVHALTTGKYDAYSVSVTCNQ